MLEILGDWIKATILDPGVIPARVGLLLTELKCLISMLRMESSSLKWATLLMPSITIRLDMFMTNGIILTIQKIATADHKASTHLPPLKHKSFTSWGIFTITECTQLIAKVPTLKDLYRSGKALLLSAQPHSLTNSALDTSISHLSLLEPIRSGLRLVGKEWMSKTTQ